MSDDARWFLDTWVDQLGHLAGWSRREVEEWANRSRLLAELSNENSLVYHRHPQYWISRTLIPEGLQSRLDPLDRIELEARVSSLLSDPDGTPKRPSERDGWDALRSDLTRLIQDAAAKTDTREPLVSFVA